MSSLGTKASKSRSPGSAKVRATKAKKSPSKKPQRPGKITAAPKSKKVAPAKTKKPVTAASKKAAARKPVETKRTVQTKATKKARKVAKEQPRTKTARKAAVTKKQAASRQSQPTPKRQPSPGTLAAVKAFEQALRLFNRHDYSGARSAFEDILKKFGDQAEIVAGVRTYIAIIEQRLARTPSVPKNADGLYNSGVFELNRGNVKEAVELFDKALKAEPRADHVLYSLSAAYARLNDPPKALDALRRSIAIRPVHRSHARRDPDFANLHNNEDFRHLTGFGFEFVEE